MVRFGVVVPLVLLPSAGSSTPDRVASHLSRSEVESFDHVTLALLSLVVQLTRFHLPWLLSSSDGSKSCG